MIWWTGLAPCEFEFIFQVALYLPSDLHHPAPPLPAPGFGHLALNGCGSDVWHLRVVAWTVDCRLDCPETRLPGVPPQKGLYLRLIDFRIT